MDEKRMEEIFADEAFVKNLLSLESPEQVQSALKEKGIELTLDEIKKIGGAMAKALENAGKDSNELSIETLDDVAGGGLSTGAQVVLQLVVNAAKPALIPAAAAAVAAAASVSAFFSRW